MLGFDLEIIHYLVIGHDDSEHVQLKYECKMKRKYFSLSKLLAQIDVIKSTFE